MLLRAPFFLGGFSRLAAHGCEILRYIARHFCFPSGSCHVGIYPNHIGPRSGKISLWVCWVGLSFHDGGAVAADGAGCPEFPGQEGTGRERCCLKYMGKESEFFVMKKGGRKDKILRVMSRAILASWISSTN